MVRSIYLCVCICFALSGCVSQRSADIEYATGLQPVMSIEEQGEVTTVVRRGNPNDDDLSDTGGTGKYLVDPKGRSGHDYQEFDDGKYSGGFEQKKDEQIVADNSVNIDKKPSEKASNIDDELNNELKKLAAQDKSTSHHDNAASNVNKPAEHKHDTQHQNIAGQDGVKVASDDDVTSGSVANNESSEGVNSPSNQQPVMDSGNALEKNGIRLSYPVRGVPTKVQNGVEFDAPEGTPVNAAASGVVVSVRRDNKFGNLVIISHTGNFLTAYAHLQNMSVQKGQKVMSGQAIGNVGSTGDTKVAKLYFAVKQGNLPVDPTLYLK